MPLWLGKEIQAMLRPELTVATAIPCGQMTFDMAVLLWHSMHDVLDVENVRPLMRRFR